MAQLTIYKPDNSCADIIDISDSLYKALYKFSQLFELEFLDLDVLKKIKGHALLVVSQKKTLGLNNITLTNEKVLMIKLVYATWKERFTSVN